MTYEELQEKWGKECFKDIHSNFLKVEEMAYNLKNTAQTMFKRVSFFIQEDLVVYVYLRIEKKDRKVVTDFNTFYKNGWNEYHEGSVCQMILDKLQIIQNEVVKVNRLFEESGIIDGTGESLKRIEEVDSEKKEKDTTLFKKNHPEFRWE